MTYGAIVQGAQGVWYFSYSRPDGRALADTPEEWLAVTETTRELAALRPILEDGTPLPPPFTINPAGSLAARAWRCRGRDYVVVLNRRKETMELLPKTLLDSQWRPLFENLLRRGSRFSLR